MWGEVLFGFLLRSKASRGVFWSSGFSPCTKTISSAFKLAFHSVVMTLVNPIIFFWLWVLTDLYDHRFLDKLSININDSQVQTVSLVAHGSGTTIVSDPPIVPSVQLGAQFSCQPCSRVFCLTNKGRRPQQIYWTTEGFHPFKAKKRTDYNPNDMRFQVRNQGL